MRWIYLKPYTLPSQKEKEKESHLGFDYCFCAEVLIIAFGQMNDYQLW